MICSSTLNCVLKCALHCKSKGKKLSLQLTVHTLDSVRKRYAVHFTFEVASNPLIILTQTQWYSKCFYIVSMCRLSKESNSDAGTECIDWLELKQAVEQSLTCKFHLALSVSFQLPTISGKTSLEIFRIFKYQPQ